MRGSLTNISMQGTVTELYRFDENVIFFGFICVTGIKFLVPFNFTVLSTVHRQWDEVFSAAEDC